MAILYKANETQFNHLGLGPLNDAVSILVTEERNGIFELEMKYPVSGKLFKELKNDRLIKADAGHKLKDQRFKIIRITKPLKGVVTVYAEHVSYLTQDLALKPKVTFSGNARQALEHWKANLVDDNPLTVWSDISTTGKINWTIDEVENARRALGGVQGSILDVYGGEYLFDNYDIYLYQKRGVNSELLIAYGRNLVDLEQEEEIANTYTSIYPYSIYTDDDGNERMVTLPEYYIDSEHVDKYARRKILVVDFTTDEIETVSALRNAARRYIKDNDVGVPRVNLKIQYIDLAKTLDYKDLALYEEVNLCDNVMIYFEKYDINTTAKVIKVVWDVLNERYDSIEVGEARASLSQAIDTVVDGKVHNVEKLAMQTLRTADGKNTIYFGLEEPLATQYPLKKNDIWYRIVDGEFTRTYIYDGVVWQLVIDMDSQEAKEQAQQARDRADDAVNRANQATEGANAAIGQAQASFDLAQENALELETLGLRFNDVEGNLMTISSTVQGLQTTVSDIDGNVSNLTQLSNTLQTRLSDAEGNINTLTLTSQSMQSTIRSLQDEISDVNLVKKTGTENIDRSYEIDINTSNRPFETGTYSIEKIEEENVIYIDSYSTLVTEKKLNSKNGLHYVEFDVKYEKNLNGTVYAQLLFYNKNGTSAGSNYLALNFVANERVQKLNSWQTFSGFLKADDFSIQRKNAYYVAVRVLVRYSGYNEPTYIRNLSWKQLDGQQTTQSQITQLSDAINMRVAKGDVINQINLDTSGVLISGKKLILDGDTTVLGTFKLDGSAHIKDASIGTAQIGTIDASKISTGTLIGINIQGARFYSTSGNDWMTLIGGNLTMQKLNGTYLQLNPDGLQGYNADGTLRFNLDKTWVSTSAVGTTNANVYLAAVPGGGGGEARVVNYNDIPGDGYVDSYRYLPLRASGIYGNYFNVNPAVPGGAKNVYVRPLSGGELRVTLSESTTNYQDARVDKVYANVLESNSLQGTSKNLYVRPQSGGEVRFTRSGSTTSYIDTRAKTAYVSDIIMNSSVGWKNFYIRTTDGGEVRVVSNADQSLYRPIRASAFNEASSRDYKTNVENYTESALEVINDLTVVTYNLKDDLANGIIDKKIGFISEDSPAIATTDGKAIQTYKLSAYNTKAIQELDSKFTNLEDKINWLKIENQYLRQRIKILEGKVA